MSNFLTPEQQRMMAQQQQAAAMGGGMTPQQQQMMMAQQQGMYGGMTPQQQQAMAQQQQGMAPQAPMNAGGGSTLIVNLPDGCLLGFDRLRNVLILNGKVSNLTLPHHQIPARPIMPSREEIAQKAAVEASREPVTKKGIMTKLGFKKGMMGESWQRRHFTLTADSLSYAKEANSSAINVIKLHKGIRVGLANASTPARRDRFEDGDHSMSSMMSAPIGQMMSETSGPLGKDFCVEVICPVQVGDMLGSVMNNSAASLAFGGGMKDVHKAKARTYYLQCSTEEEARQWRDAIQNNLDCLAAPELPSAGSFKPTAAGGFAGMDMSGLNNAMNYATNMQKSMEDAANPAKSLEWYKQSLGTAIELEQLFGYVSNLYDQLDSNGIAHR